MKKISMPGISPRESYETCSNGIADPGVKVRFGDNIAEFEAWARRYEHDAFHANLFAINPLIHKRGDNPIVFGTIRKSELTKLYDYYMLRKNPARKIYDQILISANDKCPYCGGVGRPRTLDHYLPKALFPQFSILPSNLLPCCRDCNSESKKTSYAKNASEQVIHPYFDGDHYFNEQWIKARVISDDPCSLEYYVDPPTHWSKIDKERVDRHFEDFNLPVRYGVQAAEELSTLIDQRRGFMSSFDSAAFSQYLSSIGNTTALFKNHWKKIMYQALAADAWFCAEKF